MTPLRRLLYVLVSVFSLGLTAVPLSAQPFDPPEVIPGSPIFFGGRLGEPVSVWYKAEKKLYTFYYQRDRVYFQSHFKTFHSPLEEVPGSGRLQGTGIAAIVYLGQLQLYGCGLDGQIYINVKQPHGDWSGWFTFAFHPPATVVDSGYVYRNSAGHDNVFIFFKGAGGDGYALRFSEAHRWDVLSLGNGFSGFSAAHTGVGDAFFLFGVYGPYSEGHCYSNYYLEDAGDADYGDFQGWNLADPEHPSEAHWVNVAACNFGNQGVSRAIRVYTAYPIMFPSEDVLINRSEADEFDRMGDWNPVHFGRWDAKFHVTSITFPQKQFTILMLCGLEDGRYYWMIAKERR